MTGRQRSRRLRTCGNLVILLGNLISLLGLGLIGCDRQTPAVNASKETAAKAAALNSPMDAPTAARAVAADPQRQQSFIAATRQEPPAEWQRPPDLTLTGKSVGKLYTEVVKLWDTIRFNSEDGQAINYSATLDTEMGVIEMALRPDLAPNHVRNFVALARAGYYDGLVFERAVHAKSEESPEVEIEILEAGCPLGTGDSGFGSIGYWLKSEFSRETHEAGTVGAARGADTDTAACKFYIT